MKIMVDLETLGTHSTSVILSIGAVSFDDERIHSEFHRNIDIDSCLKYGLTVCGKTIAWWMEQSNAARKQFQFRGLHLVNVLDEFSRAFNWNEVDEVCGNSPDFDLGILGHAYWAASLRQPWAHSKARDYRTFRSMFPLAVLKELTIEPCVEHNALDDARAQAMTMQALLRART